MEMKDYKWIVKLPIIITEIILESLTVNLKLF